MSTKIPYLDELWSPITGCSNTQCPTRSTCWARDIIKRFPVIHGIEGYGGPSKTFMIKKPFSEVVFHPDRLEKPLHWKKPRRVGVCFMGDLFDCNINDFDRLRVLGMMILANWHTYFVLTKQPKIMCKFLQWVQDYQYGTKKGETFTNPIFHALNSLNLNKDELYEEVEERAQWPMSHIYWGVSITSQTDADRMIPELLRIPGKHGVSYEPVLGGINFRGGLYGPDWLEGWDVSAEHDLYCDGSCANCPVAVQHQTEKVDWLVIGSSNNPRKQPCKIEWIDSAVEQAKAAGVPCFVKQIHIDGKLVKLPEGYPQEYPE